MIIGKKILIKVNTVFLFCKSQKKEVILATKCPFTPTEMKKV